MLKRFSLALLAATALGGIATQGASAADILRKAPPPAALPAPVQDWSGIYVGIEGGYGWGRQSLNSTQNFLLRPGDTNCFTENGGVFNRDCNSFREFNDFQRDFFETDNPDIPFSGHNQSGGVIGGFFGAQKQWGNWVLGIEASADYANIQGSGPGSSAQTLFTTGTLGSGCRPTVGVDCENRFTAKTNSISGFNSTIDEIGAVNAKVGYAWSPQWMIYGTGGLAFAHERHSFSNDQELFHLDCDSFTFEPPGSPTLNPGENPHGCNGNTGQVVASDFRGFVRDATNSFAGSGGTTMFGWTAGAGIDYKWQLDAGSALIFGIDYKHYGFGHHTLTVADPSGSQFSVNATQDIDVIKGRISYLFSIH